LDVCLLLPPSHFIQQSYCETATNKQSDQKGKEWSRVVSKVAVQVLKG
jgi:hypothetical protein